MAQQWAVSALGGYLAAPFLSRNLRMVSQPMMKFRQFCRVETELGRNAGDTIYFDKVGNVANEGRVVSENEVIPDTTISFTQDSMKVYEYSNSINYTGRLETLADLDINTPIIEGLKNDAAKVIDKAAATQFKSAKLCYTPTGSYAVPSYTLVTTGTPTVTASRNISVWDHKNIIDAMKSTYLMPTYDGNNYGCIASTTFLRGIKDDPEWQDAAHYGNPDLLFSGEVGTLYGCRFSSN